MRGIDQPFIIALAKIFWGNGLSKAGVAVALIGAGAASNLLQVVVTALASLIGLQITFPEVPIWFSVFLVIAGFAVAIFGPRAQAVKSEPQQVQVSAHDRELFAKYQTLISDGDLDFLRTQDFGAPFAFNSINGVCEIGGQWDGPRYEFSDRELEASFRTVKEDAKAFNSAVLTHVHPTRGNPNVATTKPDDPRAHYSEWHVAANRKLNNLATTLTGSLEEFERLVYSRLQ